MSKFVIIIFVDGVFFGFFVYNVVLHIFATAHAMDTGSIRNTRTSAHKRLYTRTYREPKTTTDSTELTRLLGAATA